MADKRVSKHWKMNTNINIDKFDIDSLNENNLINQLLLIKQSDITYTLIMTLFGSFNGKRLCNQYDTFEVPAKCFKFFNAKTNKEVSNVEPFITTIGIWIFNIFFLRDFNFSWLFGGYMNENFDADMFDDVNQKLIYALAEDKIDTETYKNFLNYSQSIMWYEDILSPNHTEAVLTISSKIEKKKKELISKNKEAIENGNIAVAEKIEKELIDYAKELLKDDPGLDVYLSGAGGSLGNNFKNMYIMRGAVKNPDPTAKKPYTIAESNYIDGVSADEYSLFANGLAAGPYGRAKKTEIGGYWEKLFGAAFQSDILDPPGSDCGSNQYIEIVLDKKNLPMFMYNYIIKSDGTLEELTSDNSDKYLGKKVKMRFSIFCKSKTGFCNKCAGNFFYRRGAMNIGLATIQIPSKLKLISMKSFHNTTVKTTQIDPWKAFSMEM